MTGVLDQHLVVHVYLPGDGPDAGAAYRAVHDIWRGCRLLFGMTDAIAGTGLPPEPPADAGTVPFGTESVLAGQERPGTDCQAVLRCHHDVLNLSVVLPGTGGTDSERWQGPDRAWTALTERHAPHLLGEARLYLARVDADAEVRSGAPALYERLRPLLPAEAAPARPGRVRGAAYDGVLALWETGDDADERALRRFLVAVAPDADHAASAWLWSGGDPALPPYARYLLHAAKLRHQLRVWQRDNHTRELKAALESLGAELRVPGAASDAAERLRARRLDAALFLDDQRALRRTVEIAADNMGRSVEGAELLRPGTPFADDAALARSFLERLDDDHAYLGIAVDRADRLGASDTPAALATSTSVTPTAPAAAPRADHARNVFVVHGRDEPAREALFAFLRSLGLRPMEWEDLVALTGQASPFLGEVIARALPYTQAVVVLMTPEDVVRLHPELRGPNEAPPEHGWALQARPNVLLELGMALVTHPDRTLIMVAGEQRPVSDIGGRNFVRMADTPEFRAKVANRLRLAGCPVDTTGQDWLTAGDFGALTAYRRRPSDAGPLSHVATQAQPGPPSLVEPGPGGHGSGAEARRKQQEA